jgi:lysophospholipase L1-like esterase
MTQPVTAESRRLRSSPCANLLLAAASLLVFGLGLEAMCRVVDLRPALGGARANPPWLGERWLVHRGGYRERLDEAGLLGRYYDLYEWDRHLLFRLRPGRELTLVDPLAPRLYRDATRWTVRTGAAGFRTPDFSREPEPGRVRVLALGDSSTFGWGVEAEETWPGRLPGALARATGQPAESFEVLNLGVPGYSTYQGRVLLERVALPLAPRLVVWSYLANDGAATGGSDAALSARRASWLGGVLALLHRSRAYETLEAWIAAARSALHPPAAPDPKDPAARNVAGVAESRRNVLAAVEAAREAGVPMLLLAQCVRSPISDTLAAVAAETGTRLVDAPALLDAAVAGVAEDPALASERARVEAVYGTKLPAEHPQLYLYLPDACHPSALGHRLVADAVAAAAAQLLGPS